MNTEPLEVDVAVIGGAPPALDELRPIIFHVWLVPEAGAARPAVDMGHAFTVYIHFTGGSATTFPSQPPLRLEELVAWPAIARQVEEFGIATGAM